MPSNKKKKILSSKYKKTKFQKTNGNGGEMSAGQRRYMFASDVMKDYESYEEQVSEEKKKIKKRSLWTTLGGVVGAGLAVMVAPAVLGAAAAGAGILGIGALTGTAASVATGLGTAAVVGGGSAIGSKKLKDLSKTGQKAITTEKFYKSEAASATKTFKEASKDIDIAAERQAIGSGVLSGLQAGGAFKWAGGKMKEGLGIGKSTGPVWPSTEGASALEKVYAESMSGPGEYRAGFHGNKYEGALSVAETKILEQQIKKGIYPTASSYIISSALGNLSDPSLYGTLQKSLSSYAFQSSIGAGIKHISGQGDVETDKPEYDFSEYYV